MSSWALLGAPIVQIGGTEGTEGQTHLCKLTQLVPHRARTAGRVGGVSGGPCWGVLPQGPCSCSGCATQPATDEGAREVGFTRGNSSEWNRKVRALLELPC